MLLIPGDSFPFVPFPLVYGIKMFFNMLEAHEKHRRVTNMKRGAEILQPLCYVGYLSSALAIASWKSLASVKISCL